MRIRLLPPSTRVGKLPYFWLVYLCFYAFYPIVGSLTIWEWAVFWAGLLAFLHLYFLGFHVRGPRLVGVIAAIVALGVLIVPINPGANVFFIYAAAFAGEGFRIRRALLLLVAIEAVIFAEMAVVGLRFEAWMPAVVFVALVGISNLHFAAMHEANEKLRLAHEEVGRLAKVAERERIARDLHDLLGHTLSVIVLKSELASKLADRDPARAVEEIREVERISREALSEVRRAVRGYQGHTFSDELANAWRALEAAGVELVCEVEPIELDPREEGVLSLALREAVTNVVRHARASRCWVRLDEVDGRARLDIRDDGVGGDAPEGAGLAGMRSRLREMAGTFERDGREGTRLCVSLPLRAVGGAES